METNMLLTTAFEIECRVTSPAFRIAAPAAHSAFGGPHSALTPFHFVEIEGEAPFLFVTEAFDA